MSVVIVVVGPKTISGPGELDPELAALAIDCIDDDLALVEDRVLPVGELWARVLGLAMNGPCDTAVLICPSWWSAARTERVDSAASGWTANLIVRRRVEVQTSVPTVVELAPELVVVHAGGRRQAIARLSTTEGVLAAIVAHVDGPGAVAVDVPSGLSRFGAELLRALRRAGVDATIVGDHELARAARAQHDATGAEAAARRRALMTPRVAVVGVAVLAAAGLSAVAFAGGSEPADEDDVTWLLEGRIAVEVPAQWSVERITSGPGSARLQVTSPVDHSAVVHVTQSDVPDAQTLDAAAETLRAALAEEPGGVFVDFAARGERAERPAVTYREVRADRRIDWTVLLDGGVRIAIGCQGSAERPGPERQCDRAIRSAHAVARK